MKKIISIMLSVLLLTGLVVTAVAAELTTCTVSADTVNASAGGEVTVPIRISDNPGFTNFGIALDYDREVLTLVSINTADGETVYLCGTLAAASPAWDPASDANAKENPAFAADQTYGYVTAASAEAIAEDGVLFTATFTVSEGFSGTAEITPIVSYIRNNTAVFSVFEEITATVEAGAVTMGLLGDVNGDGEITPVDAAMTYSIANGKLEATEARRAAADVNGDGEIGPVDAAMIYSYANGKLAKFPAAS